MVPHIRIEELLTKLCDPTPEDDSDDQPNIAVTAVPDKKKGERLIVLHTKLCKTVDELRADYRRQDCPTSLSPVLTVFAASKVYRC